MRGHSGLSDLADTSSDAWSLDPSWWCPVNNT